MSRLFLQEPAWDVGRGKKCALCRKQQPGWVSPGAGQPPGVTITTAVPGFARHSWGSSGGDNVTKDRCERRRLACGWAGTGTGHGPPGSS